MQIFTLGLCRSGTTLFWKILRQDNRLCSFDEPFNPYLYDLPTIQPKTLVDSYQKRYLSDSAAFEAHFTDIKPAEQLDSTFTVVQKKYLKWLLYDQKPYNVDFVRCNFKIDALAQLFPKALFILIERPAEAFVSSHIKPSFVGNTSKIRFELGHFYRKQTFWTRTKGYNAYNYQAIVETHYPEIFQAYLLEKYNNTTPLNQLPAYQKMLLLWQYNHDFFQKKLSKTVHLLSLGK